MCAGGGRKVTPRAPSVCRQKCGAGKGLPSTRSCARNTQAESSGIPCCCILSVSVSCRTRSRRPTPSRPAPGRRVKGKDFKIRGRGTSASALFGSCLGKEHGSTPGQAPVCVRKAVYQRFGAPAGPSCQRKGLQDKGAWYVGFCFIRLLSLEKAALNAGTGLCVRIMKLCSTFHADSVCKG